MTPGLVFLLLILLFVLVVFFERALNPAVPLAGTLSLELAVTFGSFIYWFGIGELQARDLILLKFITALILIGTNFKRVLLRLSFSGVIYPSPQFASTILIFVTAYFSSIATFSFLSGADPNNIFIALYVITSPIQGFIFTALLDDYETEKAASWWQIVMLTLPSMLFIGFGSIFALERLILGSYAVGGLFAHFAVLCLMLTKREGFLTELVLIVAVAVLCFEVYLGGSRRYMLPLAGLLVFWIVMQRRLVQVYLAHLCCMCLVVGFIWLLSTHGIAPAAEQDTVLGRGLGYRDAEFSFYLRHLSWDNLITGMQLGFQELNISHGSKGVTDVGPRLHNFYLTLLLNGGLVLLTLFILIFGYRFLIIFLRVLENRRKYSFKIYLITIFGVAWLASAWFDLPPDGLWPLGVALFWLNARSNDGSDSEVRDARC